MSKERIEPEIIINGKLVTEGQAMTIRCALDSFDSNLEENGLGDDAHGKSMVVNYQRNIRELRSFIMLNQPETN